MTKVIFNGYAVNKMIFKQLKPIVSHTQTQVKQKINANFNKEGNKGSLKLSFNTESKDAPVEIEIEIEGYFQFKIDDKDAKNKNLNHYLQNTTAEILFPYLRQIITTFTSLTNTMQPIVLPTFNIAQMLYKNEDNKG